jgi:tetratricopeptide (TPR) repeat protein
MHGFSKNKVKILFPLILILVITAAYIPTFSGEFILDDRPLVKDNLFIREFNRPALYLSHEDGVSNGGLAGYHTGYYRPLINLFYTIDYKIWGLKPSGFRTTNLILHLLTCIVLYQFLSTLLGGHLISFGVALLFGLHPVNTESVAFISARNNILVTFFSLISFYYYLKNSKEKKIWARAVSYLSFVAALLCKEFAIMLLPIFFLYNRLLTNNKNILKDEILGYIPFVLILFFYFILRANAIGSVVTPISGPNLWKSIYFTPFLILYDLKLILIPYGLHSFIIDYPNGYLSWQAFAGFIFLGFICLLLWKKRKNKILLFSVLSFLIALFPVLNIIHTSAVTVVSMRWLYFPMIFLSFSCAWYLQRLQNINRFFVLSGLSALIIYFGTYSYILNQNLWHDEDTFFRQEVQNFSNSFYAGGLAENLLEKKKYQEAERYFQVAIDNYSYKAKNYINYSALLVDTGRPDDALLYLNKAKPLTMTHKERGQWFNNMGMAYFNLRENDDAVKSFKKAIIFSPKESQFSANLGGAYGSMGDYINSVSALKKGLEIAPESIQLRKNLAVTYVRMEDYEKAILTLEKIPTHEIERNIEVEKLLKQARKGLLMKTH